MHDPAAEPTIQGASYGILSSRDIERGSVCHIASGQLYTRGKPVTDGFMCLKMGAHQDDDVCQTCAEGCAKCPGHYGHIRLHEPVINIEFSKYLTKVLTCVCFFCSRLLLSKSHPAYAGMMAIDSVKRRVANLYTISQRLRTCQDATGVSLPSPGGEPPGFGQKPCGGPQPTYACGEHGLCVVFPSRPELKITMSKIVQVLRHISDEDVRCLGMDPATSHPVNMIWQNLVVPPPCMRPPVKYGHNFTSQDDLTIRLKVIYKTNERLKRLGDAAVYISAQHEGHAEKTKVYRELHAAVASYQNSKRAKCAPEEYGVDRNCIRYRFQGKTAKKGRLRHTMMGKRQNLSGRTVVTGDPFLDIDQIGVPLSMCMVLTYPERVTAHSLQRLTQHVKNGPTVHPGANYLIRDSKTFHLKFFKRALPLRPGDVVLRHLVDDDDVLMNRQPSLHKMSLMSHRVRVVLQRSFALHIATTPAYNADFDGDEMNLTVLLDEKTRAEGREIMSVRHNLIKDGKPIIQFVQHVVLAAYILSTNRMRFPHTAMMNFIMKSTQEAREYAPGRVYSGLDLLSELLPDNLFIHTAEVHVERGKIIRCAPLTKKSLNQVIFFRIWKDCGTPAAVAFMNQLYLLSHELLQTHGLSFHAGDCIFDLPDIRLTREKCRAFTNNIADEEPDAESKIRQVHDAARDIIGAKIIEDVSARPKRIERANGLWDITQSGAKGNSTNLFQIAGMIGQQFNHEMQRMVPGLTLSHTSSRGERHGMIHASFFSGMNNVEMFYHLASSRDGLVDTAVKVSDTGYSQRKLVKAMEDIVTFHDGSARHVDGRIIQPLYGSDGFDTERLEEVQLRLGGMSEADIVQRFWLFPGCPHLARMTPDARARWEHQRPVFETVLRREVIQLLHLSAAIQTYVGHKNVTVQLPINFPHALASLQSAARDEQSQSALDLTPYEVSQAIQQLWAEIHTHFYPTSIVHRAVFLEYCATKTLWGQLCTDGIAAFTAEVKRQLHLGRVNAGTSVGVIAGQNCVEPLTQMTLNSFHSSGNYSALLGGVHRMKELMNASKTQKAPFMRVGLRDGIDPAVFGQSIMGLSVHMLATYHFITPATDASWDALQTLASWSDVQREDACTLAVLLSPTMLRKYNITPQDIVLKLFMVCPYHDVFSYSQDKSSPFIFFHVHPQHAWYIATVASFQRNGANVSPDAVMATLYEKGFSTLTLQGIRGIREFYPDDNNTIITSGSAFGEILALPGVAHEHTTTSNIHETLDVLGIDAANMSIKTEWASIMSANNTHVSTKHIHLIADLMTSGGWIAPMTYQGICTEHTPVIKQASFEKTVDSFLYGAVRGKHDANSDTMSAICWNGIMKTGTGAVEVFFESDSIPDSLTDAHQRAYQQARLAASTVLARPSRAQRDKHLLKRKRLVDRAPKLAAKRHKIGTKVKLLSYESASFTPWSPVRQ